MFATFTRKMHGNLKTYKRGRLKIRERLTKCVSLAKCRRTPKGRNGSWHPASKERMLKERMRLKIRELSESFAFAIRIESLSFGESDQCASRACAFQMGGMGAGSGFGTINVI